MARKVDLDESDRQMLLMALAHLAIERPGWKFATEAIASKMDNMAAGKPELYTLFFTLRQKQVSNSLPDDPTEESFKQALGIVKQQQPKEPNELAENRAVV